MPEQFLHGVEVVQIDDGLRPIRTVKSSVIGLIGTAPQGDENKATLIAGSRREAVTMFGAPDGTTTIPDAFDAIFDQVGAMVVTVRVPEGADAAETKSNIIGGVDAGTGQYTGVHAFLAAQSELGVTPRILIAPGWGHDVDVISELVGVAERLRAVIIADGPNTNDAAAIAFRGNFGSKRVYVVDPMVRKWDTVLDAEVTQPASPRVAGLISKMDNDRGFWWSPSNQNINGISGTARPVDFTLGDPNSRANHLNENDVTTIIQDDGFRLWGNRTCSGDPKWAFLNVVRTVDMVNESVLHAHRWAVDRNLTKTLVSDVVEGVQAYLDHLKVVGAILGGRAWADKELNTPEQIAQGKLYIDFDLSAPTPAEHITFRSHLVDDYYVNVL